MLALSVQKVIVREIVMRKKISLLTLIVVMIAFVSCKQASKNGNDNQQENLTAMKDSVKTVPVTDAVVIVLLAHPDMNKSHMNAMLSQAAAEVEGVQVINIYDYPVAPDVYRDVVKQAKGIVYEFPFYWMSAPHLLKQWTDEVFMAFTQEGLIEGKEFMVVTTTGSEEAAYQHDGRNKYTMSEYLRPYEGQANHSKMIWNDPLVVYGNPQNATVAEENLQKGKEEYKARLKAMVERVNIK